MNKNIIGLTCAACLLGMGYSAYTADAAVSCDGAALKAASYGSRSVSVTRLQQCLASRNYLRSVDIVGVYGPRTVAAVKKFYADNGIRVTGKTFGPAGMAIFNAGGSVGRADVPQNDVLQNGTTTVATESGFDLGEVVRKTIGIAGGVIENANRSISVAIPANAVGGDTEFTLSFRKSDLQPKSGVQWAPIIFTLAPSNVYFGTAPASIKVRYDPRYMVPSAFSIQNGKLVSATINDINASEHYFTMSTAIAGEYSWGYIAF